MTNHKNTINRIANTIVLFFALFGISAKAIAQDYTCPVNAIERDQRVFDMNNILERRERHYSSHWIQVIR